jgi:hypothetical protein
VPVSIFWQALSRVGASRLKEAGGKNKARFRFHYGDGEDLIELDRAALAEL